MNKKSLLLFVFGIVFGSCCNEDFIIPDDYDYIEFAIDLTARIDNFADCSNPLYTTVGATPDGESYSCTDNPYHNRWFKFTTEFSYIYIDLRVGGTEGTQLKSLLALWDTDGVTPLACDFYDSDDDDLYVSYYDLIPGETYYVSVDSFNSEGTFSICITTD